MLSLVLVVGCSGTTAQQQPGEDANPPAPTTIVSLTFDDTRADQLQVGDLVAARQMRATFYVNSTRLDREGYMTTNQLLALQAAGNEIGGHTFAHVHLTDLDSDAVQREICDDRVALLGRGLDVSSFAYPFGDESAAVRRIVQECGYSNARDLGNIASGASCPTCPHASPLTPADPFAIPAVSRISPATTVQDLQQLVLDAETSGGGWLPLVFHHVCDGCSTNAISPATLTAFLDWLAQRRANGTEVRTVREVLAAEVKPGVAAPLPAVSANLIMNPSLEIGGEEDASSPDCWSQRASGVSTGTLSATTDAYQGATAQQLAVTSFTDGTRRLATRIECALPAQGGHSYRVSAWYKADVSPQFVVTYRTSTGAWKSLEQSPSLPPSPVYIQGLYTTSPLPADATGISIGLGLSAVGTLTMDAFDAVDALAPLGDAPPTVAVTGLAEGATVTGVVDVPAVASDLDGVARLDLRVNDKLVDFTDREPFVLHWDTADVHAGPYVVTVRAFDRTGLVATSAPVTVNVSR
jgi:peptidoglycan/xylan/chitin deacetylase (PgdA/CDA1 family)